MREDVIRKGDTLPPGWVWATLGEACEITMGQSPPSDTYNTDRIGLPFYQGKAEFGDLYPAPVKWCSRPGKTAEAGDVLVSIRAPVGPTNLCRETSCIGRGLAALRPQAGMGSLYFLYLLRHIEQRLAEQATGTTFAAIGGSVLRNQEIPLAPLPEQRRIVAEIEKQFTRLDAGVAALKRVQVNLRRYRASVLKAACEGRLAPQDPADEPADRLLARILAERRARWEAEHPGKKYVEPVASVTDGLPELAEGWCWVTLEQVSRGDRHALSSGPFGSALGTKDYRASGVPVIRGKNVKNGTILLADMVHVSEEKALSLARSVANPGDLVVVAVGSSGQPAIVPEGLPRAILSQNCNKVSLAADLVTFRYVLITMQIGATQTQLIDVTTDTARSFLSLTNLKRTIIPLPPLPEQHRIVAEVERRLSVVAAMEAAVTANLARAGRLRQAVLKRAFEGRLVAQEV
jgi:type I restriction enzyme, S subunit